MHIKKLKLSGFRSHVDTTLENLGKHVLVLGPNACGKSGLVDAIAYLFTGACRGTDERGAGSETLLSPAVDGRPAQGSIIAETDKGLLNRMIGQGSKSAAQERIASITKLDRQSLRCALRSQAFLDMDTKDQEALLRSLAKAEVKVEDIKKVFNLTDTGVSLESLTSLDGVAQAYQQVYGARTALKKQLEDLGEAPGAPADVAWEGSEALKANADTLEAMLESVEATLAAYAKVREANQKLDWLRGDKKSLEDRIATLRTKIAPYPAKAELEKKVESLKAAAQEEEQVRTKRRQDAQGWMDKVREATSAIDRAQVSLRKYMNLSDGKAECATCEQPINKLRLRQIIEGLQASIKDQEKLRDTAQKAAKKLDDGGLLPGESMSALESAQDDLVAIGAIRAEAVGIKTRLADIDKLLATAPTALDPDGEAKAQAAKTGLVMHRAYRDEVSRLQASKAKTAKAIEQAEAAVKALAVGGPVRALHMGDGFKDIMDAISQYAVTLGVGEVAIVNAPKWGIAVNGRPAELLSASERWRVSLAFAAIIAKKTGVKLICLDGADILDQEMRTSLMTLIEGDDFEQIIVTATSTMEPGEGIPGWTTIFLNTDENGVSQVLQAAAV